MAVRMNVAKDPFATAATHWNNQVSGATPTRGASDAAAPSWGGYINVNQQGLIGTLDLAAAGAPTPTASSWATVSVVYQSATPLKIGLASWYSDDYSGFTGWEAVSEVAAAATFAAVTVRVQIPAGTLNVSRLRFLAKNSTTGAGKIFAACVVFEDTAPAGAGYFDGNSANTATETYAWVSGANGASTQTTAAAEPDPDPEPEPIPVGIGLNYITPDTLAVFLGRYDTKTRTMAGQHIPVIEEFVFGYVRGKGVTVDADGRYIFERSLRAVILAAVARLIVNPPQLSRESADGYEAVGSFSGFTLAEKAVLNRYRRQAA